jgi:Fuc2NAc and GlcNAc transferase
VDIPNVRSSHSVPTPRGGGVSIVLAFLLACLALARRVVIPGNLMWALVGGGLALAIAGFLDDRFLLSARVRIMIQTAAAAWALWQLNGVASLHLAGIALGWWWTRQLIALVGLVWMTNLYNFMDGIDGLAGTEALCASGFGGLLLFWCGFGGMAQGAWSLAAASAGFLAWNWPPAKIFMGDAGSGFLGFVLGVFALSSAIKRPWMLWPWLILLSVFIVDSTVTLLRRWMNRERWYQAHCSHAYQHAARRWSSHGKVTIAIAAINVAWLFPLAFAACVWQTDGPVLAAIGGVPLVFLAFWCNAGREPASVKTISSNSPVGIGTELQT